MSHPARLPSPEEALAERDAGQDAEEPLTVDDVRYADAVEDLPDAQDLSFYETPAELPDEDGALIRQQDGTFCLAPANLIEPRVDITIVMYRTTDSNDAACAATQVEGADVGSMPRTGILTARMFDGRSPADSCWRLCGVRAGVGSSGDGQAVLPLRGDELRQVHQSAAGRLQL